MLDSWERYLSPVHAQREFARCCSEAAGTFEELRGVVERVFTRTKAKSVACLGAGMLNDLPYASFVASGAELHLVDWVPEIVEAGIGASIITEGALGDAECIYCMPGQDRTRRYCTAFDSEDMQSAKLCGNYVPSSGAGIGCAAFQRGEEPHLYTEDATGGYASAFARGVSARLEAVRTWRQAFGVAGEFAKKLAHYEKNLSIPDGSIDLTVSSMVISQFEYEPYEFFAKQVAGRIGTPDFQDEKRLMPALERLRSTLLTNSLEHHLDEIKRIMAPDGVCLMTFEMFHYDPVQEEWFLVNEMHQALAMIAERFHFDFSLLEEGDDLVTFETKEHRSRVTCLVLRPHSA